jgi:hypothetical protein
MAFSIYINDLAPSTADELNVNDNNLAFSPTAAVPVGKLAIIPVVWDNVSLVSADDTVNVSASDTKSNAWTRAAEATYSAGGAPQDGVLVSVLYSVITTQIETTDTITPTHALTNTSSKGATLLTFNYDTSKTIAVAGKAYQRVAASTAYTVTVSSLPSEEHLWVGVNGIDVAPANVNNTDGTFVLITQGATAAFGDGTAGARAAYKIATDTGETYDNTGLVSADRATLLVAFREVAGGIPVVTRRSLLGVGV